MTIYYWDQASLDSQFADDEQIKNVIQSILYKTYNPSDLEKLNGPNGQFLYSFRMSQKQRLLFTTYKNCLHVLEYLPNHEYSKSRFLKKGVLKRYLESHADITFETITRDEDKPSFTKIGEEKQPLNYFNGQFIQLSGPQNKIISSPYLPLILTGPAGSGKTYSSLSILSKYLQTNILDENACSLYLTKNPNLVNAISSTWREMVPEAIANKVEFKAYQQLFFNETDTLVDFEIFQQWYDNLPTHSPIKELGARQAYCEFRTCSGLNQREYQALGVKQCQIHEHSNKSVWYALYQDYIAHLKACDLVDPNFSLPTKETRQYDLIIFDEAQLMTVAALVNAYESSINGHVVYCFDPHQNMLGSSPTREILSVVFHNKSIGIHNARLNHCYRSPFYVTKMINQVIDMEYRITGGKIDKLESSELNSAIDEYKGNVHLYTPTQLPEHSWIKERAQTNHLAVVTNEDLIDEAIEKFDTALVFTPQQIQGLGYHTIIVYKLFSNEADLSILRSINPKLMDNASSPSKSNRAKKGQGSRELSPWFKNIYVALSRASNTLVWIENKNRTTSAFLSEIKQVVNEYEHAEESQKANTVDRLPDTNWQDELERLRQKGNADEQADRIVSKLGISTEVSQTTQVSKYHKPTDWYSKQKSYRNKLIWHDSTARGLDQLGEILLKNCWMNPNHVTDDNETLLMLACYHGNYSLVQKLLGADFEIPVNFSIEQQESRGNALIFAISRNNTNIVRLLLEDDRIDLRLSERSYLVLACEVASVEMVELFLNCPRYAEYVNDGYQHRQDHLVTPLMMAAQNNNTTMLASLLACRSFDLSKARIDYTCLLALELKSHEFLKQVILDEQIFNQLSGQTALEVLMKASKLDDMTVVEKLLTHPALDPNDGTSTYVSKAMCFDDLSIGAEATISLVEKKVTPFDQACESERKDLINIFLKDARIVQHLLQTEDILDGDFWREKPASIVDELLTNNLIFKATVRGMCQNPEAYLKLLYDKPLFCLALIRCKAKIWGIVLDSEQLALDKNEHRSLLSTQILGSSLSHPSALKLVLLKSKRDGSFFDNSFSQELLQQCLAIVNDLVENDTPTPNTGGPA